MNLDFRTEVARLLALPPGAQLEDRTLFAEELDSLGVTEVCVAAEEMLGVSMEFSEAKKCATYGQLRVLLQRKGGNP